MKQNRWARNRPSFNHPVGKMPWRRAWQPTPVFLPGESHGQRAWRATVHRVSKGPTWLKRLSTAGPEFTWWYDNDKDGVTERTQVEDSPMNGARYLLVWMEGVGERKGERLFLNVCFSTQSLYIKSHIPLLSQVLTFSSLEWEERNTSRMSLEKEIQC